MGKVKASPHVRIEILSALADGELEAQAAHAARAHAEVCVRCAALLARFARLDKQLTEPAALGCEAVAPLLSARLDGEASIEERALLDAHLADCIGCRGQRAAWTALETALRPERLSHPS
ncbi:MAG: anti-sigma factor family protein, partial [Thermoleophilaceae bacterium]